MYCKIIISRDEVDISCVCGSYCSLSSLEWSVCDAFTYPDSLVCTVAEVDCNVACYKFPVFVINYCLDDYTVTECYVKLVSVIKAEVRIQSVYGNVYMVSCCSVETVITTVYCYDIMFSCIFWSVCVVFTNIYCNRLCSVIECECDISFYRILECWYEYCAFLIVEYSWSRFDVES